MSDCKDMNNEKSQSIASKQAQPQDQPGGQQEMSLTDLVNMAFLASGPEVPPQIKEQLMRTADHMAMEPALEVNALGRVLKMVLSGDKNPDLSDLPDEMAAVVREVIGK